MRIDLFIVFLKLNILKVDKRN